MKSILLYIAALLILASCQQAVLRIDEVPPNTPVGAQIYVTGNFNLWDPGDDNYRLTLQKDSTYIVQLPITFGKVEYKFTRGDWSTCEQDLCGNQIENRYFNKLSGDTIAHMIESWKDLDPINCDSITILVDKIPDNTPKDDPIKIAGSFNAWNPGDKSEYFLRLDSIRNQYVVTVPRIAYDGKTNNLLTYKFVREDITVSETDEYGREMTPRVLNFEKGDTVRVEIKNWNDLVKAPLNTVTIILTSIPEYTPQNSKIYLTGNFNNWNPGDLLYIFEKNDNGFYEITIPRRKYGLSFKITRGDWDNEFADNCGNNLPNQDYNYDEIDTLRIAVDNWIDFKPKINQEVVIVVDDYPKNTPADAQLRICNQEIIYPVNLPAFDLEKQGNRYVTKIKRNKLYYDFIVTRGSYYSQEVNSDGRFVIPRNIRNNCDDTVFVSVEAWNDMIVDEPYTTLLVKKLPKRTPEKDNIYLVGKFNGWDPSDEKFVLKRNDKGDLYIDVPKRWLRFGYKFTRGDWKSVEGNRIGQMRLNRYYKGNKEILEIEILSWEDKSIF